MEDKVPSVCMRVKRKSWDRQLLTLLFVEIWGTSQEGGLGLPPPILSGLRDSRSNTVKRLGQIPHIASFAPQRPRKFPFPASLVWKILDLTSRLVPAMVRDWLV